MPDAMPTPFIQPTDSTPFFALVSPPVPRYLLKSPWTANDPLIKDYRLDEGEL